ncbi:MAG: nucleotidyltransferase family protein, partial [Gemmatimonadaceae bacterium]
MSESMDWPSFLDLAAQSGVEPMVLENLRTAFGDLIPSDILKELRARERRTRLAIISKTFAHIELVRSLAKHSIESIVLKGPAIGIAAYGGYERRDFVDVDLLVHKAELVPAADVLRSLGYNALYPDNIEEWLIGSQHALEFSDGMSHVELHWALFPRSLALDFDLQELWLRSRLVECMHSRIRVLSAEHLFIYVCAHATKHGWSSLRFLSDFAQLADRLTADESARAHALSIRYGIRRMVALGFVMMRDTFGEMPPQFLQTDSRQKGDPLASLARANLESGGQSSKFLPAGVGDIHPYLDLLVFWIRTRERYRDKFRIAAMTLFSPSAQDVERGTAGVYKPF